MKVALFGRSDVGLVREHNEDSFLVLRLDDGTLDLDALRLHDLTPAGTLLVVCDGMGGAAAGEVASMMAVHGMREAMCTDGLPPPPEGITDDEPTAWARKLRQSARDTNQKIYREARQNIARAGMGTTMTAVLLHGTDAIIGQVGDSRAYVWRQGHFTQVTRDQSLVNQLIENGQITPEQAKFFEHSNVILQALGVQEEVEVQLSRVVLARGDRILVCSDGLVGVVPDEEIGAVLGQVADPAEATRLLIEMANAGGGPDNISVIVAHTDGGELPEPATLPPLEYATWRIDPAPAGVAAAAGLFDRPDSPTREVVSPRRSGRGRALSARAARERLSMALVLALIFGSIAGGWALYRQTVPCRLQAEAAGLAVLADGQDSGVRTAEGLTELRLSPGHHVLALRGAGAPQAPKAVEVSTDALCAVRFDGVGEGGE